MSWRSQTRERCSGWTDETMLFGFRADGTLDVTDRPRRPRLMHKAMQESGEFVRIVTVKVSSYVSWRDMRVTSEVVRDWRSNG